MAMQDQGGSRSMIDRIKNILIEPKAEWERIDAEPATVAGIFTGWVLILSAVPVLAGVIGGLVFGYRALGFVVHPSIGTVLTGAVIQYCVGVVGVFVLALIIDALAPTFQGSKSQVQATKVAAYSMTAGWVAGIGALIPSLGLAGLVALIGGLYSLYLLYLGLPRLMKSPAEKAIPYIVSVIVAAIVLYFVVGMVVASLSSMVGVGAATPAMIGSSSGSVTVPGVGTLDVDKLQQASQRLEAVSGQAQQDKGPVAAVPPETLQALLPASLGDYRRVELSSSGGSVGGFGGSTAEARYESGGSSFALKVSDIAAAGALAAMGTALDVRTNSQSETGYEKMGTIDGRMTTEKWDTQAGRGEYNVLVAQRFMVEASGSVPSIDVLKGAVGAVGIARLESLAG